MKIPLKQGLKQRFLPSVPPEMRRRYENSIKTRIETNIQGIYISSAYRRYENSIKTRIETHHIAFYAILYIAVVMKIPLKQGLKPVIRNCYDDQTEGRYENSIKTRIET